MKTVGDFKKAGLVFVEGDLILSVSTDPQSIGVELLDCCIKTDPEWGGFTHIIGGKFAHAEWVVHSFTWRENTGVRPEFTGEIEVGLTNGRYHTGYSSEFEWCIREFASSIKRWRPVLPASIPTETPEEKEAFEAMEAEPEFKAGDVVECLRGDTTEGAFITEIFAIQGHALFGYMIEHHRSPVALDLRHYTVRPLNPQLTELVDIIGRHDNPTECAKAVLKAGYSK